MQGTMAAPVGSSIFVALAITFIAAIVLLLLRYYLPLRTTPAYLLVPVFLALAIPATIILLVPIDLASNASSETGVARGIWLPGRALLVGWRISYWLTFVLTWIVLPLLGSYSDSGYRDPKDRLLDALQSNARYQLTVLTLASLGAVYFFLTQGFHFESLKALIMALAYAWGLILAVFLMGHGLVALPRRLYATASPARRLRGLYIAAPKIHDSLMDAADELDGYEQAVAQLKLRKQGSALAFKDWIDELDDMCRSLPDARLPPSAAAVLPRAVTAPPPVITERYLADLTRRLKRARHKKTRYASEWTHLVDAAVRTQTTLDAASTQKLTFAGPSPYAGFLDRAVLLNPRARFHLYTHVLPALYYAGAGMCALASACILWSETTKPLAPKLSLVGLTIVHHPSSSRGQIGFAGQVIASLWLGYMFTCALFSISSVKVWGNRALVRRATYAESAAWYASYVARLSVPLAYNFGGFVPPTVFRASVFYGFLGRLIDLTHLGEGFDRWFPALILLPVIAAYAGLYRKVGGWVGFGDVVIDEQDPEEGGWREGRALVEREARGLAGSLSRVPARPRGGEREPLVAVDGPPEPRSAREAPAPREARPRARQPVVEDEEPEGFFADFAHRVRNTFEGVEGPGWFGGGDTARGAGARRGGDEEESPAWRSWFGRPGEGRVRL
ncbi:hypothetical protein EJ06DRAFT_504806 [Trichodelitschia bisporula]|uniref:Uncharacterized protein n=1 Tax=Trichodelitschia bisporula TaxID=703511 RepID=A0A6G1I5M4_9PEZI|nr:hypothetical protein EJ06DRAFT_504806 [Trichodelitschia bisporula]